jgi:uncharacterized DUF497 family protein
LSGFWFAVVFLIVPKSVPALRKLGGFLCPVCGMHRHATTPDATLDDIRHTLCYRAGMKQIHWNAEKNQTLIRERGISFEDILFSMQSGDFLDGICHPNSEKYSNQRLFVVSVDDYEYLAPYIETADEIFLKTIIPSRKATKQYLRGRYE